ncbi:unnamed protein product [Ranitomeya imitator]|uniref:Uncharacterized protein n=1 Tax=Ranitomeya imitator TaxID=111125 RepID=A0ABN9KZ96_9NEOB|nr:unnamed protein product [Ranitomeya imitator]
MKRWVKHLYVVPENEPNPTPSPPTRAILPPKIFPPSNTVRLNEVLFSVDKLYFANELIFYEYMETFSPKIFRLFDCFYTIQLSFILNIISYCTISVSDEYVTLASIPTVSISFGFNYYKDQDEYEVCEDFTSPSESAVKPKPLPSPRNLPKPPISLLPQKPDIVPVYQIKGISKLIKLCLPKVQCFCDSLTSPPSERQRSPKLSNAPEYKVQEMSLLRWGHRYLKSYHFISLNRTSYQYKLCCIPELASCEMEAEALKRYLQDLLRLQHVIYRAKLVMEV